MTVEKRVLEIKTFYKNNGNPIATVREFPVGLGRNITPNESSVRKLVKKFETSSELNFKKNWAAAFCSN